MKAENFDYSALPENARQVFVITAYTVSRAPAEETPAGDAP